MVDMNKGDVMDIDACCTGGEDGKGPRGMAWGAAQGDTPGCNPCPRGTISGSGASSANDPTGNITQLSTMECRGS